MPHENLPPLTYQDLLNLPPDVQEAIRQYPKEHRKHILAKTLQGIGHAAGVPYTPKADQSLEREKVNLEYAKLKAKMDEVDADMKGKEMLFDREIERNQTLLYKALTTAMVAESDSIRDRLGASETLDYNQGFQKYEFATKKLEEGGWNHNFGMWSKGTTMDNTTARRLQRYERFSEYVQPEYDSENNIIGYEIIDPERRHQLIDQYFSDIAPMTNKEVAFFTAQLASRTAGGYDGAIGFDVYSTLGIGKEGKLVNQNSAELGKRANTLNLYDFSSLLTDVQQAAKWRDRAEAIDEKWLPIQEDGFDQLVTSGEQFAAKHVLDMRKDADKLFKSIVSNREARNAAEIHAQANPQQLSSGRLHTGTRPIALSELQIEAGMKVETPAGAPSPGVAGRAAPVDTTGQPPVPTEPGAAPTAAAPTAPTGIAPTGEYDTPEGLLTSGLSPGQIAAQMVGMTQQEVGGVIEELGNPAYQDDPTYKQMKQVMLSEDTISRYMHQKGWESLPDTERFRWLGQDLKKAAQEKRQEAWKETADDPNKPAYEQTRARVRSYLAGDYGDKDERKPLFYGAPGSVLTKAGSGLNRLTDKIAQKRGLKGEPTEEDARAASRAAEVDPTRIRSLGPEGDVPVDVPSDTEVKEIIARANEPGAGFQLDKDGIQEEYAEGTLFVMQGTGYWRSNKDNTVTYVSGDKAGQTIKNPSTGEPETGFQTVQMMRENQQGPFFTRDVEDIEDFDAPAITREGTLAEQGRAASRYDKKGRLVSTRAVGDVPMGQTRADITAIKDLQTAMESDPRFRVGTTRRDADVSQLPFFIDPSEITGMTFREAKSFIQSKFNQEGLRITDEDLDQLTQPYRPEIPERISDIPFEGEFTDFRSGRIDALQGQLAPPMDKDVEEEEAAIATDLAQQTSQQIQAGEAAEARGKEEREKQEWVETPAEAAKAIRTETQAEAWGTTTAEELRKQRREKNREAMKALWARPGSNG